MATAINENNNVKDTEMKQRRKKNVATIEEKKESVYVLPSAMKYQDGDTFLCCNGSMTDNYNTKIICTESHEKERCLNTWEDVLYHRGYRNEDNSITLLRSEKCPLCPAVLAGQLSIKKKHLKYKHLMEARILCGLPEGSSDEMIEEAIYKLSKIFITPTGYNIQTEKKLRECRYYNCREINNTEHLKNFSHTKLVTKPEQVKVAAKVVAAKVVATKVEPPKVDPSYESDDEISDAMMMKIMSKHKK